MRHRLLILALFVLACLAPRPVVAQSAADREAEARARLQSGQAPVTPPRPSGTARPADDYRTLTTRQLAERCLGSFGFGMSMGLLNDNRNRIGQLRRQNPALDDLFRRPDLWQGILHVYDGYAKTLAVDPPTKAAVQVSINLTFFDEIYSQPELQAQLRGRERLFLKANLELMQLDRRRLVGRIAAEPDSNMSLDLGRTALRLVEKFAPPAAARFKAVPDQFSRQPTAPELLKYNDRVLKAFDALVPLYPDTPDPLALIKRIGAENFSRQVWQTHQNVVDAANRKHTPVNYKGEIPKEFWAPAIRELRPEAVYYMGTVIIAIVLKSGAQGEEGVAVTLPFSSDGPALALGRGDSFAPFADAFGSLALFKRHARRVPQGLAVPD